MLDYKAVYSSLELSKRIVSCLELADPAAIKPANRAETIRSINDILQGRSEVSVDALLAEMTRVLGHHHAVKHRVLRRGVRDFLHQKEMLNHIYSKSSNQVYPYKIDHGPWGMSLKIIDQALYDQAAMDGFPPDFFRESYFDHVTFYCLPERADFDGSMFQDCTFAVCRIDDASFTRVNMWGGEFHSSMLDHVDFRKASLIHTHFHDSTFHHVSFQDAGFAGSNFIDCALDHIDFFNALVNGCSFGRVTASDIHSLNTAHITQSGATEEECRWNRAAVFRALGVEQKW